MGPGTSILDTAMGPLVSDNVSFRKSANWSFGKWHTHSCLLWKVQLQSCVSFVPISMFSVGFPCYEQHLFMRHHFPWGRRWSAPSDCFPGGRAFAELVVSMRAAGAAVYLFLPCLHASEAVRCSGHKVNCSQHWEYLQETSVSEVRRAGLLHSLKSWQVLRLSRNVRFWTDQPFPAARGFVLLGSRGNSGRSLDSTLVWSDLRSASPQEVESGREKPVFAGLQQSFDQL